FYGFFFFFLFFFSSRRRHTRSYGDWSSDVCSSDLTGGDGARHAVRPRGRRTACLAPSPPVSKARASLRRDSPERSSLDRPGRRRSEERRVGKERTTRRWSERWRKKSG